jgi:MFS transporter, FHS family, L-fucose permease
LNYAKVMLIQFAFFSAYFIFSIPSAKLIDWLGYKKTMVIGVVTMGIGALFFIPAASVPSFPLFLGALMVLAGGITALQVAANPYVAVLGPPETASSRLNLSQAFNSLGTAIAPYLGGRLILNATRQNIETVRQMSAEALQTYRVQEASSVKVPYLIIGLALIVLGVLISLFKLPPMPEAERHGETGPHQSVWRYRHLVLGTVAIFVYVGAEVSIGSFLINYFSQSYIGNIPEVVAARYVSYYWAGAMVGRFIGSAVLQKVRTGIVLGIAAVAACLLVLTSILTVGQVAMWSIILVGFFNSVMFPSIFTLGIAKLGPLTGDGSGLLIMAIVGGAIIPVIQGVLADHIGIHHAFFLPAICYLYILYYALKGSKPVLTT